MLLMNWVIPSVMSMSVLRHQKLTVMLGLALINYDSNKHSVTSGNNQVNSETLKLQCLEGQVLLTIMQLQGLAHNVLLKMS